MNIDITIPAQSVTIPSQDVSVSIPAAQIVYQNSWINQSGFIGSSGSPVGILTIASSGLYRLNTAYILNSGPDIFIDFLVNGSLYFQPNTISSGQLISPILIALNTGDTISMYTRGTGTPNYDLYVAIENLL